MAAAAPSSPPAEGGLPSRDEAPAFEPRPAPEDQAPAGQARPSSQAPADMTRSVSEGFEWREPLPSDTSSLQPADEDIEVFPISAVLCAVWSAIIVGAMATTWAVGGISERHHHESASLHWHSRVALFLVLQAALMELCILVSTSAAAGIADEHVRPAPDGDGGSPSTTAQLRLGGQQFVDSALALLAFAIKYLTARHLTMPSGIIMHLNTLTATPRPVYFARFAQWAAAVPIVVLLTNRAFLAAHGHAAALRRSAAGLALSSFYCQCAWMMEVTPLSTARWVLMALTFGGFVLSSLDQVCIAYSVPITSARRLKLGMLFLQILSFTLYSGTYVCSYFGIISAEAEQCVYCYMDVTVKVSHSCMLALIRNYDNLRVIQHWWLESAAARRDFERLVKRARVPIFALGLEGRVTAWNESLAQLTGLPASGVLGRAVAALVCEESKETLQQALSRVKSGRACSGPVEIRLRRASQDGAAGNDPRAPRGEGGVKPVDLVLVFVPRLAREGALEGIVAIGQDLTELSELKAVEQKKVQLMAVVSHELRSPLHGMIGLTNLMKSSAEGTVFTRQLSLVWSCAHRLLHLVTSIMDLTEAEQEQHKGAADLKQRTLVNMMDVAEEVVVMAAVARDRSGRPLLSPQVKLASALPELEEFPLVLGSSYKLVQLMYNLVTNACKFTRQGSVTLRARHNKEMGTLEIDVQDTGPGIPPDTQTRIFQAFEQGGNEATNCGSFQGMGLGLTLCNDIIRSHDGRIALRSEVGAGSTFTISMPCESAFASKPGPHEEPLSVSMFRAAEKEQSSPRGESALASRPGPGEEPLSVSMDRTEEKERGKPQATSAPAVTGKAAACEPTAALLAAEKRPPVVLSVDDDEINQEVINNALGKEYKVVRAMSGQEALEHLATCGLSSPRGAGEGNKPPLPDMILLDIQMPGLTGFDVLAQIRKDYSGAHTRLPVIMVSAKAPMELAALRSYSDGCSDFLAKPFNADILKAKISVALKLKQERRASVEGSKSLGDAARAAREATRAGGDAVEAAQRRVEEAEARARRAVDTAAAATNEAKAAVDRAAALEEQLGRLRGELEAQRAEAAAAEAAREDLQRRARAAAAAAAAEEAAAAAPPPARAAGPRATPPPPVGLGQQPLAEAPEAAKAREAAEAQEAANDPEAATGHAQSDSPHQQQHQPQQHPHQHQHPPQPQQPQHLPPQQQQSQQQQQLRQRPQCQQLPADEPASHSALSSGQAPVVPWLCEQLQDREAEIMQLNARLASQRAAGDLAARHLELVLQAMQCSRHLLQGQGGRVPGAAEGG